VSLLSRFLVDELLSIRPADGFACVTIQGPYKFACRHCAEWIAKFEPRLLTISAQTTTTTEEKGKAKPAPKPEHSSANSTTREAKSGRGSRGADTSPASYCLSLSLPRLSHLGCLSHADLLSLFTHYSCCSLTAIPGWFASPTRKWYERLLEERVQRVREKMPKEAMQQESAQSQPQATKSKSQQKKQQQEKPAVSEKQVDEEKHAVDTLTGEEKHVEHPHEGVVKTEPPTGAKARPLDLKPAAQM
jgi:hypothetical protein